MSVSKRMREIKRHLLGRVKEQGLKKVLNVMLCEIVISCKSVPEIESKWIFI